MKNISVLIVALFALGAAGVVAVAQKGSIHESPHKVLVRSCEKCHVATSFKDIRFDHNETEFAVDGHHDKVKCLDCHSIEDFTRVEASCASCHTDVHRQQMGPYCVRCHSTEGWSVFDSERIHASTNFPIVGRHLVLDCESCHEGMTIYRFRQTPSRCVDCHRADYESVASPNHAASGFSTECMTCHTMTAWEPATMTDHDVFFPIFNGNHAGAWSTCGDCHVSPGNFRVVSCIDCHDHSQTLMDPVHAGMTGYTWATPDCLGCHPRGDAGRYGEHDTLFFPIFSGRHAGEWNSCSACHLVPANKKSFTCIECHEHDQPRMDDKHLGEVQDYTYTPTSCMDCHADGRAEG